MKIAAVVLAVVWLVAVFLLAREVKK